MVFPGIDEKGAWWKATTFHSASDAAIAEARSKLGARVDFVNAVFERATLPRRYDNIVLTHVLEHLDDPVGVLRRVNDEWLADGGQETVAVR